MQDKITPKQYYDTTIRENKLMFPNVDWEGITNEFLQFNVMLSTPLSELAKAQLIAPWILERFNNFKNLGITSAMSLLLGTPLSYLITENATNKTGAYLASMIPDTFQHVRLTPLERAHLNFVRACVAICIYGYES